MACSPWLLRILLRLGLGLSLLLGYTVNALLEASNAVGLSELGLAKPEVPFAPPPAPCKEGDCPVTSEMPDVVLLTLCADEIKSFCSQMPIYSVLGCLLDTSFDLTKYMSSACRTETHLQQWMQSKLFLSGPHIYDGCAQDVNKFCPTLAYEVNSPRRLRLVIGCLKKRLAETELTPDCGAFLMIYMRQGSLDYTKDVATAFECETEIYRHCQSVVPSPPAESRDGQVTECLKLKFLAHYITDPMCSEQIIVALQASSTDIRTDALLYVACHHDMTVNCAGVVQGGGHQVACLLQVVQARSKMRPTCLHMLHRRFAMWRVAAAMSPNSFPGFTVRVNTFNSVLQYLKFIMIGGIILLLFLIGMCVYIVLSRKRKCVLKKETHYVQITPWNK